MATELIPARKGAATWLARGGAVKVINTPGTQVVDHLGLCGGRYGRVHVHGAQPGGHEPADPKIGDTLVTNHRRPILTLLEDTSGQVHDTFIAACDRWRYEGLGVVGYHDSCEDNLHAALKTLDLKAPKTPSPLNLFMNIPWDVEGKIDWKPPVSEAESYVVLRAEVFRLCGGVFLVVRRNRADQWSGLLAHGRAFRRFEAGAF